MTNKDTKAHTKETKVAAKVSNESVHDTTHVKNKENNVSDHANIPENANKIDGKPTKADPTATHIGKVAVNQAPASQSIDGQPVSNQYADTFGGPADPGAVVPANNPTTKNVQDLNAVETDVDHRKDKPLTYKESVEEAGLVEGDTVRIVRRPLPTEVEAWGGHWPVELDHTIGRKYTLGADEGAKGYSIDVGNGHVYLFPVYSLQKVVG